MAWIVNNPEWSDTRIQLGNEEILRPLAFGSNWIKIRIAMRFMFIGQPFSIPAAFMGLGVSQGSTGYQNLNTVGWMGVTSFSAPNTWTLQAGVPGYWLAGAAYVGWKVGTLTGNAAESLTNVPCSLYPAHAAWLLDITRINTDLGGANWSYTFGCKTNAYGNTDISFSSFIEQVRNISTATTGYQLSTTLTAATYPGPTAFDTLSVFWNHSIPCLEISDLVVIRVA